MKALDALPTGTRVFLDTAPVVYYVESVSPFFLSMQSVFKRIDNGVVHAITSPITLAECLVRPLRFGNTNLQRLFVELISAGRNTSFVEIGLSITQQAAEMRARYNLSLMDALQVAVARGAQCNVFLTNDIRLRRVLEIHVLMVSDID